MASRYQNEIDTEAARPAARHPGRSTLLATGAGLIRLEPDDPKVDDADDGPEDAPPPRFEPT